MVTDGVGKGSRAETTRSKIKKVYRMCVAPYGKMNEKPLDTSAIGHGDYIYFYSSPQMMHTRSFISLSESFWLLTVYNGGRPFCIGGD
jgi:hypothetical protein